jgi:magnesium-transporting ATPase (P-type)
MNEKTRLTEDRKWRRREYGSALSSDRDSARHPPPDIHEPASLEISSSSMTAGEPCVEMEGVGERRELRYRRITSASVSLPKEPWYRKLQVPGVYNRASPHSNAVHTTKYTVINFLPKNLWEQFHRFANIFFLFIALLNFVPEVEAFGKEIGYGPLVFVLSATAIKDVFEDWRRYRSDREVNAKLCRVYDR